MRKTLMANLGPILINEFPEELILEILSISILDSLAILPSLSSSNKLFERILNDLALWRALNDKYFPYIKERNLLEYINDPKASFKKEYLRYKKADEFEAWNIGINLILECLCGHFEKIETQASETIVQESTKTLLSKKHKNHLYQMSLANGHTDTWPKLDNYERKCAFQLAARNGSLNTVNWFLNEHPVDISGTDRAITLRIASLQNYSPIVSAILLHSRGPEFEKQLETEVRLVTPQTRKDIHAWAEKFNCQPILNAIEVFKDNNQNDTRTMQRPFHL